MSESTEATSTATSKAVKTIVDPCYYGSLPTAFRLWANAVKLNLDVCQPCVVESYDRATHRANVKPLILKERLQTKEKFAATRMNVSVWRWMSGGYVIDAPVKAGDTGWLVASDRNAVAAKNANAAAATKKDGATAPTADDRASHIPNAGFFIPDAWGKLETPDMGGFADGFTVSLLSDKKDAKGNPIYQQTMLLTDDGLVLKGLRLDGNYGWISLNQNNLNINPSKEYTAEIHDVVVLSGDKTTDSDGNLHLKTKILGILADYGDRDGNDIVIPAGGGTSKDFTISASSSVDGITLSAKRTASDTSVHYDLVLGKGKEDDDDDDDNYCNSITTDGDTPGASSGSGETTDNNITNDASGMSGSSSDGGGGSGGGNDISYTPCDY